MKYLLVLLFFLVPQTQTKPKVVLTPTRVVHHGHVDMRGSGFTPKKDVISHLRRPDGTEFPTLPMMTNDRGEITHDIDTLLLMPGVHEVWVEDPAAKTTSDIMRFEVILEADRPNR
jgi:hypothetical protein